MFYGNRMNRVPLHFPYYSYFAGKYPGNKDGKNLFCVPPAILDSVDSSIPNAIYADYSNSIDITSISLPESWKGRKDRSYYMGSPCLPFNV